MPRRSQRAPGEWCRDNGVTPPPGSFESATPAWRRRPERRPCHHSPHRGSSHRSAPPASCSPSASTSVAGCSGVPSSSREFLQQAWFIASVTIIPTALVAIPFGAVIALQVGGLIKQFGAQSFTGSASVLAVVREAGPIATSLLIAGAGGSAIAADLGARKIREELDAMMVLGIDPIQRLVVPRVLACMLVAVFLNGLVSVVGVIGGYVFNVVLQDGTPGAYLASFTALAQLPDLWQGMAKALSSV